MHTVHVHVHVKPESAEAFKQATIANARESIKESGIARFDVLQQQDDPTDFSWSKRIGPRRRRQRTKKPNIIRPGATLSPR